LSRGEKSPGFRINGMLSRIDHVGIAVRDLDQAIQVYERLLGLRVSGSSAKVSRWP